MWDALDSKCVSCTCLYYEHITQTHLHTLHLSKLQCSSAPAPGPVPQKAHWNISSFNQTNVSNYLNTLWKIAKLGFERSLKIPARQHAMYRFNSASYWKGPPTLQSDWLPFQSSRVYWLASDAATRTLFWMDVQCSSRERVQLAACDWLWRWILLATIWAWWRVGCTSAMFVVLCHPLTLTHHAVGETSY